MSGAPVRRRTAPVPTSRTTTSRTTSRTDRHRRDRGVASLELLGSFPLLLVIAFTGLQLGVYLWAVTDVDDAARQGARAQSLGRNGCGAVRSAVADSIDVTSCSATGGRGPNSPTRLTLSADVPLAALVEDLLPRATVTRTVELP